MSPLCLLPEGMPFLHGRQVTELSNWVYRKTGAAGSVGNLLSECFALFVCVCATFVVGSFVLG